MRIPGKIDRRPVIGWVFGIVLLFLTPVGVSAQVVPAMRNPPNFHVFGAYTFGSSDFSKNHSAGYTIGGNLQSAHLWGAELRGSYLRWGYQERRYDALFGPRVALHRGRLSPYAAALAGPGHVITFHNNDYHSWKSGTAIEWKLLGGVDFYAGHHFSFRLGEVSFAKAYVLQGFSSIDFSGGVVYKLPIRQR